MRNTSTSTDTATRLTPYAHGRGLARRRGRRAFDVAGFGLLGHLHTLARASGVTVIGELRPAGEHTLVVR
ncbi:MAG: hypothetical protein ACRDRL_24415 [Sciscionella sp.]